MATETIPVIDLGPFINNEEGALDRTAKELRVALTEPGQWERVREEIAINFEAPVHLSTLFIPHLRKQTRAAIVNITSGLSFAPMARVPVYCATKAALHSFTLSLRHQLADTAIAVGLGRQEAERTIASGWEAGRRQRRR